MLQYTTIVPATLELLKLLMRNDILKDFALAGGTAIALQIGHRISVDLDLFSQSDFDTSDILQELQQHFQVDIAQQKRNTLNINVEHPRGTGNWTKVDLLKYPYPLLLPLVEVDSIRLFSTDDIIPMKLSAIANRGAKKDFFDIYFLLKQHSLPEMLKLFSWKFPNINQFHLLKSLTYFNDAEEETNPIILDKTTWQQVKDTIQTEVTSIL